VLGGGLVTGAILAGDSGEQRVWILDETVMVQETTIAPTCMAKVGTTAAFVVRSTIWASC
jgi:hypothetical protein